MAVNLAVTSAVFRSILGRGLRHLFRDSDDSAAMIKKIENNFDAVQDLDGEFRRPVTKIYIGALRGVFITNPIEIAAVAMYCMLFANKSVPQEDGWRGWLCLQHLDIFGWSRGLSQVSTNTEGTCLLCLLLIEK